MPLRTRFTVAVTISKLVTLAETPSTTEIRPRSNCTTARPAQEAAEEPGQNEWLQVQPGKVANLPAELHSYAEQFCSAVDNATVTGAVNTLAEGGDLNEHLVGQIADQMQLEPNEVRARADQLRAAHTQQAHNIVGENASAIFDYANQHQPALLRDAINKHVTQEDPLGYDKVVQAFWLDLPKHPAAILTARNAAQLEPQRGRDGTITVDIPGHGRTTWAAAVRAGLIGPPRR